MKKFLLSMICLSVFSVNAKVAFICKSGNSELGAINALNESVSAKNRQLIVSATVSVLTDNIKELSAPTVVKVTSADDVLAGPFTACSSVVY